MSIFISIADYVIKYTYDKNRETPKDQGGKSASEEKTEWSGSNF